MKSMSGVEQQPGVVPGLVPGEDLQPPAGRFLQTLEKVEELFGQSFVFQRLCRTLCQFFGQTLDGQVIGDQGKGRMRGNKVGNA